MTFPNWLRRARAPTNCLGPSYTSREGARFSKAPETFRARKDIFRSSVCKNGEVYTPETSSMK